MKAALAIVTISTLNFLYGCPVVAAEPPLTKMAIAEGKDTRFAHLATTVGFGGDRKERAELPRSPVSEYT